MTHAHPECGNGVTWSLELRRGATRRRLAEGIAQGSKEWKVGPIEGLAIQAGDLVSLAIGPRDGNHSCDLTAIDLRLVEVGEPGRTWDLAADVSGDVLAGNPHADRLGHPGVWHFYAEPDKGGGRGRPDRPRRLGPGPVAGREGRRREAIGSPRRLQALLASGEPAPKDGPDATLRRQLRSLGGPLLGAILRGRPAGEADPGPATAPADATWGLDPSIFGKHPSGQGHRPRQPLRPGPRRDLVPAPGRARRRGRAGHDRRARRGDRAPRGASSSTWSPASRPRGPGLTRAG